jgi:AraC family transcriptional regulator
MIGSAMAEATFDDDTTDLADGSRVPILNTVEQVARLLGKPQPLPPWTLPCGTRLTPAWTCDAFRGYAPGMNDHVISAYHRREHRCSWSVGDQRMAATLRPGTLTVIPATYDGQWAMEAPLEISHVYLSDERLKFCAESFERTKPVELVGRLGFEDPSAARVLELLSKEAGSSSAPTLFVDEALDLLCLQLIRRHSAFPGNGAKPAAQGLTPKQLRLVTDYIRENLDRDITLAELARLVHLSRFYFCTAFRLATGRKPHEWLTIARMERARTLLKDRSLRIVDIGLAVGYQTPSAFTAAFRKVVGKTPSAFRRQVC